MTTAMATPAITAPPPRPSSTKSATSLTGYSTIGCVVSWRVRCQEGPHRGLRQWRLPSLGRRQEVADLLEGTSGVAVELRVVAAHGGRLGILAAVDHRRPEDQRALERGHPLED